MEKKHKVLVVKDLCGRLPYRVLCKLDLAGYLEWNKDYKESFEEYAKIRENAFEVIDSRQYHLYAYVCTDRFELLEFESEEVGVPVEFIKPYLRPMSSMTEEELKEYHKTFFYHERYDNEHKTGQNCSITFETYDWLNSHHFDYRGLIKKGLALEMPEEMVKEELRRLKYEAERQG